MQQLKYSLRSLEMFAPWIRNIYIVTNGQVPNWINLNNNKINIIFHYQIFNSIENDLPTFNSNAIEMHLHKIPGLRYLLAPLSLSLVALLSCNV